MPQTPSSFFSMLKRVQASMHSQLRKDENIYCGQFQGHSTHFAVDCRWEAEGSGAGRRDCGPRCSSEALAYSRVARLLGQGTFPVCLI